MKNDRIKEVPRFVFGGLLSGFKDKRHRNFENKHLKAYLEGAVRFQFGRDPITKDPIYYAVKRILLNPPKNHK